jgi:glycogen synthase
MNNKDVGSLLLSTIVIKEPSKLELDKFKKEFLFQFTNRLIAQKSLKYIEDLEKYITELKYLLYHVEKLDKQEYINLLTELNNRRKDYRAMEEKLEAANKTIEKLKRKLRKQDE